MALSSNEQDFVRRMCGAIDQIPELKSLIINQSRVPAQSYMQIRGAPLKGKVLNWGRDSAHFSTAAVSDLKTVAHGLGVVPEVVILTGEDSGSSVIVGAVYVTDSTNFTCKFRDVDGATRGPGNLNFDWWACG
jgi:hypothetical protein